MNFEEGLIAELGTIPKLANKTFPIVAPQKTAAPFAVYKKENIKFKKTFGGISNKAEGIYSLVLVEKNYAELQSLSGDTINKLLNLQSMPIGGAGPLIENITLEILGDKYEQEVDLYRQDIQMRVNY